MGNMTILASFILLITQINGKVLRLPCITEGNFDVYFVGKRLTGSRIATLNSIEDTACMIKCAENHECSSYNYKFTENICEISSKYAQFDNNTNLEDAENWIFKTTNYSKTLVGPTCRKLNPCKAGILCVEKCISPFYECVHCNESMTGLHCDIPLDVDECAKNPCVNAASCIDKVNDYECKCNPGYGGKNCEIDIDECYSLPCINGGTCRNNVGSYSCDCPDAYQGINCEEDANECLSGKHNCDISRATCKNLIGGFECSCNEDYFGDGRNCIANSAKAKPSSQSSNHGDYVASRANDGNRDGRYAYCCITGNELNPWWQVDITKKIAVITVAIRTTMDLHPGRINPFFISVGDNPASGGQNNPLCVNSGTVGGTERKFFRCPAPLPGRYVSVFLKRQNHLQICEVEVFRDIILFRTTDQSTTAYNLVSGKAVDYNKNTCTHTAEGVDNAWWMVDLFRPFYIESINVTNRQPDQYGNFTYRLADFNVRVGHIKDPNVNPMCKANASFPSAGTKQFWCDKPLRGRYIYIEQNLKNEPLSVCEVAIN